MRLVALLILVFGVALAGGAIFFASEAFRAREAALVTRNTGPDTVGVLVAGVGLDFGDPLTEESIRIMQWPRGGLPEGAFTSMEDLIGSDPDRPRYALRAIGKAEPVLASRVTEFGVRPRMISTLPPGMRAVSIQIDAVSGVSGFIAPGDRVDIVLTRSLDNEMTSQIVLQNVVIIAIDQKSDTEAASPRLGRTATVAVSPDDALILRTAQSAGKLSLFLRGMGETDIVDIAPVGAGDLLGERAAEPTAAPSTDFTVRVRRGTGVIDETFDGTAGDGTAGDGAVGGSDGVEPGGN